MSSIRPLIPLLVTVGFLLGGNGLQGTVIAVRGAQEGFSATVIGLFGTAYFAGFLLGCLWATRVLRSVGHIRVFAALAALASSATLIMPIVVEPVTWAVLRFLTGICFAGLFTTMESWFNSGSTNENRARVLSLYRIVDIGSVIAAQYLMPLFGTDGFTIFTVMAMMISLSLVPVSLGDRSNPRPPTEMSLDLGGVWRISPLACFGCMVVGMTTAAFRTVGPVYGELLGFSVTDIANFMSAGIVGGVFLQYPLGHLSDRWDRRAVLILATAGALAASLALAFLAGADLSANLLLVLVFGAFAMPLYSLSAAHANDHAGKDDFVRLAAGLLFYFSLGAVIGPPVAAWLMQIYGAPMLFITTSVIYVLLIVVTLARMRARPAVPVSLRERFIPLLRTSPLFLRLARRAAPPEQRDEGK